MNQTNYFFGYFFEPTITLKPDVFFSAWAFTFKGQLKKLHEELVVEDLDGSFDHFQAMPFLDFCLLVYQERSDLIDDLQN